MKPFGTTMNGRIIRGPRSTFKKETRGLGEFFFDAAINHGDKICQIDSLTGEKESFSSVKDRSTLAAIHMSKLGINEEDVILFCSRNNLNITIPVLASLYLGAKVASIDPTQSSRDCAHCITLVRPRCIFVEEESVKLVEDSLLEADFKSDVIVIGNSPKYKKFSDLQTTSQDKDKFRPIVVSDCHDTAFIYFSSGTTGLPKGICITHFGILNSVIALLDNDTLKPDVTINFASLYWVSGLILLTISFVTGGSRILSLKFDAEKVLQLIETYKITYMFLPPAYTYQLTSLGNFGDYDLGSLYSILVCGAPISSKQLLKTRQCFKNTFVSSGYGCSEGSGVLTGFNLTRDKHLLNKTESCGKCLKDVEIKVVDIESREHLGPNQRGEICIKSPYLMKSYYKMDSSACYDEEGFLTTGDIGYYDEDYCFYIIDRIKEMFKYRSWQVVPSPLECILQEHPAVKEAVVFGIPHEIDEFHPAACVILKDGMNVPAGEIEKFLIGKVSEWQKLRGGLKIVESIPKTPSGKLYRRKMREIFLMSLNLK